MGSCRRRTTRRARLDQPTFRGRSGHARPVQDLLSLPSLARIVKDEDRDAPSFLGLTQIVPATSPSLSRQPESVDLRARGSRATVLRQTCYQLPGPLL